MLHIIPGDMWAGAEAQVFYTIKELKGNTDHTTSVILFNQGELHKRLTKEGCNVNIIDEQRYGSFEIGRRIQEVLKVERPNIIHVHEYKSHITATLATLCSNKRCKIIRTIHGLTAIPWNRKCLKAGLIFLLENVLIMFKTDCLVAVSKTLEATFRKRFRSVRIAQINNAIPMVFNIDEPREFVRSRFGIKPSVFWIGTVARYVPVKNLDMLIEAAKHLHQMGMEFKVSIFGEGYLRSWLQEKINRYRLENIVRLNGHHDDIMPILQALDVFALTSKHEGLPMSLLEAMAVGTIPICTNVGGMKEVIEDNRSGFLIDARDVNALVNRIQLVSANRSDNHAMREAAMCRIRERYSIDKAVKELSLLYEGI